MPHWHCTASTQRALASKLSPRPGHSRSPAPIPSGNGNVAQITLHLNKAMDSGLTNAAGGGGSRCFAPNGSSRRRFGLTGRWAFLLARQFVRMAADTDSDDVWRYTRPRCSPQCYAQINLESVARVEFESDAPRTMDMDYVAGWNESFQRIKVKPSKFDLFRRRCGVTAGRNRIVSP